MDDPTSRTLTLAGGRKIGYAEYGSPNGQPVFSFHGWPGSRLCGAHSDETAKKLNARIISLERPGIGLSSPQPKRTLLDHAKDVEALADHLGLEEYRVIVCELSNCPQLRTAC